MQTAGLWQKRIDPLPLPYQIAYSEGDNECNVTWVVYDRTCNNRTCIYQEA